MSIFLINPFVLTPITTIVRTFFDAGYTVASSATTVTQTTYKTLNTTEVSGKNYAIFWHAILANQSTASDAIALLFESPTTRQRFNMESQDATDQLSVGGAYSYVGGTNKTFTLDALEEATITNDIENYSLSGLELDDSDLQNYDGGQTDSTSTTYATKASVTITEPGDYLIIASASLLQSAAAVTKCRVFDGTTAYGETTAIYAQDVSNWVPYWHVRKLTLTNQTISLQIGRVAATGTASIREASVIALKLDKFENNYYAEQMTEQTTTTTTAFGAIGLSSNFSVTNPSNKHLLIAAGELRHGATNSSVLARLFNASTSVDYAGTHFREANATTEYMPTVVCRIVDFTQATNDIEWQFYVEGNTGRIRNMAIALLDLGTP